MADREQTILGRISRERVEQVADRKPQEAPRLAPPRRDALTLDLVTRAFGRDAVLAVGAPLEIVQEVEHAGTRYRFVATHEAGTTFRARLTGPGGDVWSDRFDAASFPGVSGVVADALGAPRPPAEPAPAPSAPAVPPQLMPRPGEVWVMHVLVEQATPDEIRYTGTDVDGRPYGAARVLKRRDFEAVFACERGAWRLLVTIDGVADGLVSYRQLDARREPSSAGRRIPLAVLMANFVPEAAAY